MPVSLHDDTIPAPERDQLRFEAGLVSDFRDETFIREWAALSARAVEPSPFFEPDYLLSIDRFWERTGEIKLIAVRDSVRGNELVGLFPVIVKGARKGFPVPVTAIVMNRMAGHGTPLISSEKIGCVWTCFLDFVNQSRAFPSVVYCQELHAEEPIASALNEMHRQGVIDRQVTESHDKAVVNAQVSKADYVKGWSKSKKRNIRKRHKQLSDLGRVNMAFMHQDQPNFKGTLLNILEIEQSGWKGKQNTALLSNEKTQKLARSVFAEPKFGLKTVLGCLYLDEKLIAGTINLITQDRMYSFKGAYDESYASYSPGILLDVWMMEQQLESETISELDSCTDQGHPLGEIWLDRKKVEECFCVIADSSNSKKILRTITLRNRFLSAFNASKKLIRGSSRFVRLQKGPAK